MDQLHGWLQEQLNESKTEPNSGLGKAISYLLNHWQPLTLFLREKGAPLDNNLCTGYAASWIMPCALLVLLVFVGGSLVLGSAAIGIIRDSPETPAGRPSAGTGPA